MSIKKMMYSLLVALIFISFLSTMGTFIVLNQNQANGKVVNYSGIVRGGSQRVTKLHILGEDAKAQIEKVSSNITALNQGDAKLGIPKPTDKDFITKMQSVKIYWDNTMLPHFQEAYTPLDSEKFLKDSEAFFLLSDKAVSSAEEFTKKGIYVIQFMTVVTFLLILCCVIVIAFIINNKIIKPIKEIEQGMIGFSKGQLQTQITYQSKNELGSLADSLRISMNTLHDYIQDIDQAMHLMSTGDFDINLHHNFIGDFKGIQTSISSFVIKISETFSQLNAASDQVYFGSDQVCSAAQSLAQGSTEQASSIQELSDVISKISTQVNKNANNSHKASEFANAAMIAVTASDKHMRELLNSMEQIDGMSSQIGKIVKTIEDIAFQTNILALNAAVEAARAGSAGKGFAVVADEVRNLASKSAEAAQGTAVLIESSLSLIKKGVIIARETAADLEQIRTDTRATQKMSTNISKASQTQAQTLEQTAAGVEQINNVINTNSATSQESAASAQELSSQANLMKSFIGRFKIKGN